MGQMVKKRWREGKGWILFLTKVGRKGETQKWKRTGNSKTS
jgi:hypothetical protein